jgi:hypothetical protein
VSVEIAVVIPTRNRDSLAIAAVGSLLGQGVEIFVSDNSDAAGAVRDFCEGREGVHYLRPPSVLPMAEHWDWAVRQAMARSSATHLSVHYDRAVSKPGLWPALAAAAAARPNLLMTFMRDNIVAYPPPRRLWQLPWTGRTYTVSSARLASLVAAGKVREIAQVLPVLSNCLVPRGVLDRLQARFGSVCRGSGPDSAFMARFLALHQQSLHFDCAVEVLCGSERSTGLGFLRGVGGDFPDFRRIAGDEPWLPHAPVPGLNIGFNLLFHDYESVRRETGPRLPPMDQPKVLETLAADLPWVVDPEEKAGLVRILRDHGWTGVEPKPFSSPSVRFAAYQYAVLFCARWLGSAPNTINGFQFRDDDTALACALRYPRRRQHRPGHIALAEPMELS